MSKKADPQGGEKTIVNQTPTKYEVVNFPCYSFLKESSWKERRN